MCKKMCKNITLNDVKDSAFLANESYENFPNGGVVTNPATKASFEVINTKEDGIAYRGAELKDPNDFRTNARVEF